MGVSAGAAVPGGVARLVVPRFSVDRSIGKDGLSAEFLKVVEEGSQKPNFQIWFEAALSDEALKQICARLPPGHFARTLFRPGVTQRSTVENVPASQDPAKAAMEILVMARMLELGHYVNTNGNLTPPVSNYTWLGKYLPNTPESARGLLRLIEANNKYATRARYPDPSLAKLVEIDPAAVVFHGRSLKAAASETSAGVPAKKPTDEFQEVDPAHRKRARLLPPDALSVIQSFDRSMVGMDQVKDLLWGAAMAPLTQARVPGLAQTDASSSSQAFFGPKGSGKTTSAQAYAELLVATSPIVSGPIYQLDAADLVSRWIGDRALTYSGLAPLAGGVIILEGLERMFTGAGEKGADLGKTALQALDDFIKNNPDTVILVTGDEKETTKVLQQVPSLSALLLGSVSPPVHLTKSTDAEIRQLVDRQLVQLKIGSTPEVAAALTREISRYRGSIGFANAVTVEAFVRGAVQRAATRALEEDPASAEIVTLRMADVIVAPEQRAAALERAHASNKKMDGWGLVKEWLEMVEATASANVRRQENGEPPIGRGTHSLLLGKPGTGKTVSVDALADTLFGTNAVSELKVVKVNANTNPTLEEFKHALEMSFGGVLFVDEAYKLSDEILEFLLTYLDDPDVRRNHSVLLGGYLKRVIERLKAVNDGLVSRFPFTVYFEDVDDASMGTTLTTKAEELRFKVSADAVESAVKGLIDVRDQPDFGNYRDIEQLIHLAGMAQSLRRLRAARAVGTSIEEYNRRDPEGLKMLELPDMVSAQKSFRRS